MGVTPDRNRERGKDPKMEKWIKVAGAEGLKGLNIIIKNKKCKEF